MDSKCIPVGSRKSQLALIQTDCVIKELCNLYPNITFEVISMSTIGDKILDKSLSKIGEKSLFTKELEIALEKKKVDFLVHSLKDLPTSLPNGMCIGAVCKREDARDAVVLHAKHEGYTLATLPKESVIGTSSLRRRAQLQYAHPHLRFKSVRGNLNTRLKKLDDEQYDGLILAVAGLTRMDLSERISHVLSDSECMYAVGQGALAIECRTDDAQTLKLISRLSHRETLLCCIAERSFMKGLGGGCSVPIAVWSEIKNSKLKLKGGVFSLDGSVRLVSNVECILENRDQKDINEEIKDYCGIISREIPDKTLHSAERLGIILADNLLRQGARDILNKAREQNEQSLD